MRPNEITILTKEKETYNSDYIYTKADEFKDEERLIILTRIPSNGINCLIYKGRILVTDEFLDADVNPEVIVGTAKILSVINEFDDILDMNQYIIPPQ